MCTQLPAESLYCDSTDVINSITVHVTEPVNGSHQYIYDQPILSHNDEQGIYNFTFQVDHHQYWRPFNITMSVNNSVGTSPFTDHITVGGIDNGMYTVIINYI